MSDITQIELSLEQAKKLVDRKNMLTKLMSNREFKKLILDGYFQEEPARLVSCLTDPTASAHRQQIDDQMMGISCLQQFFRTLTIQGQMAERSIGEHEAELELLRAEAEEA